MDKWEYKTTGKLKEEELNALGEEGWELAGVINDTTGTTTMMSLGSGGGGSTSTKVSLIFKRRKP